MPALPPRLSLEQVRRLAKDLLRDLKDGDRAAIRRLAVVSAPSTLAGAQLAIAREYGFPSWARLKRDVELREMWWWGVLRSLRPVGMAGEEGFEPSIS